MSTASRYIILLGASIGCTGMLYWLALLLHIPFIVTCLLIAAAIFFLFRWAKDNTADQSAKYATLTWAILLTGILMIVQKSYMPATKHGSWDAWAIWNLHSKYLADGAHWRHLFMNTEIAHADYPLGLPAVLAFLNRIFAGHFSLAIPFAFSCFIMLCIPVLVYTETTKKSIIIAALTLYFFSQDVFYITRGVSQYADTLLGFFFLVAMICINHAAEDRKMIALTAFILGCCAWTKNEGLILAGIFAIFYAPVFFRKNNIIYALMGIVLPLTAWLTFKINNPVRNDLLEKQSNIKALLLTKSRYQTVYDSFRLNLNEKFHYLKIGVYIYLIICLLEKRMPGKQLLLVLTCLLVYMMIYVVTPQDINWHIATSQDRLMHQLMPATMYILANQFSEKFKFSFYQQTKAD